MGKDDKKAAAPKGKAPAKKKEESSDEEPEDSDDEILKLEDKVEELTKANEALKKKQEEAAKETEELKKELEALKKENETLKKDNESLKKDKGATASKGTISLFKKKTAENVAEAAAAPVTPINEPIDSNKYNEVITELDLIKAREAEKDAELARLKEEREKLRYEVSHLRTEVQNYKAAEEYDEDNLKKKAEAAAAAKKKAEEEAAAAKKKAEEEAAAAAAKKKAEEEAAKKKAEEEDDGEDDPDYISNEPFEICISDDQEVKLTLWSDKLNNILIKDLAKDVDDSKGLTSCIKSSSKIIAEITALATKIAPREFRTRDAHCQKAVQCTDEFKQATLDFSEQVKQFVAKTVKSKKVVDAGAVVAKKAKALSEYYKTLPHDDE